VTQTTPAGWYPDPQNPAQQRYWDGAAWTQSVAPMAPPQPVVQPPSASASALASARVSAKGAAESVMNFVEGQQKRMDDKKRQEKEAAEAAAKAAAESARIEREKTAAFIKKYWWALLAGAVVVVLIFAIGIAKEREVGGGRTAAAANSSSSTKTVGPAAVVATTAPTAQELADRALESTFPVESARRAAVVAMTNAMAVDVFASDGNSYDASKFHSYADTSGKVADYFMNVSSWGTWSANGGQTWHVDSLVLKNTWDTSFDVSLDVKVDGSKYIISNVTVTRDDATDPSELSEEDHPYYSIPARLIKDDRKQAEVDALDHSGDLDKYVARTAFEKHGKSAFPYGFKCAWTMDLINEEQRSDGSWFFKVGVKITNQYGATRDAVAEGVVSGTTDTPIVGDFYAY